jgi:hypothetical protein
VTCVLIMDAGGASSLAVSAFRQMAAGQIGLYRARRDFFAGTRPAVTVDKRVSHRSTGSFAQAA